MVWRVHSPELELDGTERTHEEPFLAKRVNSTSFHFGRERCGELGDRIFHGKITSHDIHLAPPAMRGCENAESGPVYGRAAVERPNSERRGTAEGGSPDWQSHVSWDWVSNDGPTNTGSMEFTTCLGEEKSHPCGSHPT